MHRVRWLAAAVAIPSLGVASWHGIVAEALGRVDPVEWEKEHPSPPPPPSEPGAHDVTIASTRQVVPSPNLASETEVQAANNNLDVVRHSDGRVYLAFRTAPNHFAGTQTKIQVISSMDELTWRHEATFALGRDLREPLLFSWGERLFLYFARLGTDPYDFEPDGMSMTAQQTDRTWTEPVSINDAGRIPWRIRFIDDQPVMVAYRGGQNLYSMGDEPVDVEFLTTRDGVVWQPFDANRPLVAQGGGSETDFVVRKDGSLFAVMRNEAGDGDGYGSKLCRAPAEDPTAFSCVGVPQKYDSPFVFERDDEVYVLARRNLTTDGRYDVATGPRFYRTTRNQLAYITSAKRCSLFRYVEEEQRLAFVLDLPSKGDTCFPAAIEGSTDSELVVYDYSSDIDGPELPWAAGQRRNTHVYRHSLSFVPRVAKR